MVNRRFESTKKERNQFNGKISFEVQNIYILKNSFQSFCKTTVNTEMTPKGMGLMQDKFKSETSNFDTLSDDCKTTSVNLCRQSSSINYGIFYEL